MPGVDNSFKGLTLGEVVGPKWSGIPSYHVEHLSELMLVPYVYQLCIVNNIYALPDKQCVAACCFNKIIHP
jgi:hypothetical protein